MLPREKAMNSSSPHKILHGSSSAEIGNHSPTGWVSLSVIMYTATSLLIGLYGAHVVAPHTFQSYANEYPAIKYLVYFFDAVEAYSPFHEFIEDDAASADIVSRVSSTKIFTKEELKAHDGSIVGKGPYLALMGEVFDVSSKVETYGPDGGYSFFSGKDGSRAFVTGDFSEAGLTDDIDNLSYQDYIGLQEW